MMNKLRAALLASIAVAAVYIAQDKLLNETIILNDQVTTESMQTLLTSITDDSPFVDRFGTTRLILNSPGGSVNEMNLFIRTAKGHDRYIITEVPGVAASAAADMFLMGDVRRMHKNATVIIHEIRIALPTGGQATYTDLKSILETGQAAPLSKMSSLEVALIMKVFTKEDLSKLVEDLGKEHEFHIQYIMEHTGLTRDAVTTNLLVPNVDVYLDLKTALKFNVATEEL